MDCPRPTVSTPVGKVSVTVTVYTEVIDGDTVIDALVWFPGLHKYSSVPVAAGADAVNTTSSPGQILASFTLTSRGSHVTPAEPKKDRGRLVTAELKLDICNKYCSPAITLKGGSKLAAAAPGGRGFAIPVKPADGPFQLHLMGGNVLLAMSSQAVGEYGHIIQSKKPVPPAAPNEN